MNNGIGLVRTTFDEIAAYVDELECGEKIVFTSEFPLGQTEITQYHIIVKMQIMYESDYIIAVGRLYGNNTIAKDINIIADGNADDEDGRIEGLKELLQEYYDKYMDKNEEEAIYFITGAGGKF